MSRAATSKRAAVAQPAATKMPAATKNPDAKSAAAPKPSPAELKAAMQARSGVERKPARKPAEEAPPPVIGKGRKGRKAIVVYLHPFAKDQLEKIAGEHKRTVQDLGVEAVNLLFRSYGEKPIA